ncbi:BMP family ABC transporter substrate-binding protein [Metabacillus schmidteae]|uniref:BMP family ABC transporter substrate-binding protein n=1 Tax=Metabacillus schmidteae TaxID=2730405 RepID=UPI001F25E649|nr:BMP family ABC transporter substrate-binding protein [Metabacillus schmidteae]
MMQQSTQLRFIGIMAVIVGIVFISIIGFKTKDIISEIVTTGSSVKTKVTIITNDKIVDQSWGSLAYKGKLKMEELFPVDVTLYSEINTNELIKDTIETAIQNKTEVIIGHGREFSEMFTKAAKKYPDIHFITLHGTSQYPNQSVYTFDQGEVEYFAALCAAKMTKTNKVGLIDAFEAREKNPEFESGLAYYKPEIEFYYRYVDSRDDGKKATKILQQLIDEGVDVVYSKGNSYNRDVIDLAKKSGIYVIGYLDDQSYMGKDHVITSVKNDVSQAYVVMMEDYFSEDGIPHGQVMLSAEHGVYSLAPFGPMISDKDKQFIESEMSKYKKGEITFPSLK